MGIRPPSSWRRRVGEISILTAAAFAFAPMQDMGGRLGPLDIALVVGFVILSLGIHEAAHGWVALKCGDTTARDLGRITLNPIAHIDPFMTILLPALLAFAGQPPFGGAKPVPVTYHRLRNPPRDMALVALAGPASNFLIAIVFAIALKLCLAYGHYDVQQPVIQVLIWSMYANITLAAFNLLPIPPLDGSRVMNWLLPASMRAGYGFLEPFGILIVFALIRFVPQVQHIVGEMIDGFWWAIDGLTSGIQ
ncbi:MAG: site-2 protease family protein [Planctomycetota bacterium]